MIGAGVFRREQQKHEVDRLAVDRLEIDRAIEPRKQPEQLFQFRQLAVRNGDAIPTAVVPSFSRCNSTRTRALVLSGQARRGRKLLNRLFFADHFQSRDDRLRRDKSVIVMGRSEVMNRQVAR